MTLKNKNTIFTFFAFISCVSLLISKADYVFAEEKEDTHTVIQKHLDKETEETTEEVTEEEPEVEKEILDRKKEKHSAAYVVLGRELTKAEKQLYDGLTVAEIKSELLHREQRLVIVRALLAVGEGESVKDVLEILPLSKLQTFADLLTEFKEYMEKYGSVLSGIKTELVYNIKDNEQAFKQAASKAYQIVFGTPKDKQNIQEITSFLQENNALTYSKMIAALMESMTPEIKKDMLFKILDEIERADLKNNKDFVEKILAQKFTHENLKKLLDQISPKKPKK